MSLLVWGAMFEVGVQSIDHQHRTLFDLANRLAEAIMQGTGAEPLGQIFNELVRYTQHHFVMEEQLMALHGYPAAVQHKTAHQELIQQVSEYRRAFATADLQIADKMLQFFTVWLSHHIMETDKALARDLKHKGVQ